MNFIKHPNNTTYLVHRSLVHQLQQNRQKTANSKTRSEVRGGGKKPWKQKGTGRARAGSIRSPLWKGGGIIFGPKPKIISHKLNTQERQLAIRQLLQNKHVNTIIISEKDLILEYPRTQLLYKYLTILNKKSDDKILIIVNKKSTNLYLASRNLKHINIIQANHLNTIAILNTDKICITEEALSTIQKVYHA